MRTSVLLAAAAAALAACSGSPDADGLAWVTYQPEGRGGMDALLTGTVADAGGCLVIAGGTGGDPTTRTTVVFSADDSRPGRMQVGDEVELGGGFVDAATIRGGGYEIPDQCTLEGEVFLVATEW